MATPESSDKATDDELHEPSETGVEPFYASRSAAQLYRATPLRVLWQHAPYFHDGSGATVEAVIEHYNSARTLNPAAQQKADLVQYSSSL